MKFKKTAAHLLSYGNLYEFASECFFTRLFPFFFIHIDGGVRWHDVVVVICIIIILLYTSIFCVRNAVYTSFCNAIIKYLSCIYAIVYTGKYIRLCDSDIGVFIRKRIDETFNIMKKDRGPGVKSVETGIHCVSQSGCVLISSVK